MTIEVSVCIPVPVDRERMELLDRVLESLGEQTDDRFEVVVAVDGGGPEDLAVELPTYPLTVVASPRPAGDIAHRNHARNRAWQAARGRLVWFIAADFLVPPNAIRHIILADEQIRSRGFASVLSPAMSMLKARPSEWLDLSSHDFYGLARKLESRSTYSGFAERATDPRDGVCFEPVELKEGMPCLDRRIVEALGGFDEFYIGWGGNGEEFSDRLRGLDMAGLCEVNLLRSVLCIHQPHTKDQTARTKETKQRQRRREKRAKELRQSPEWWHSITKAVRELMPDIAGEGWARRRDLEPPPELISAAPIIQKMVRRRGMVLVAGEYAEQIVGHMKLELRTPARQANGADLSSAAAFVGVDVAADELLATARELRPGTAIVLFAKTRADQAGAPQPSHYQRLFPGVSMEGHRRLGEDRITFFAGRLVRRTTC